MWYIKRQSDRKMKQKIIWAQRVELFKKIWYNDISDFYNQKENGTKISKYIWKLKNKNIKYKIDWKTIHHIGKSKTHKSFAVLAY